MITKTTKTITCMLAALGMVVSLSIPAHAEYLGTLPKDQEWTMGVTSSSAEDIAITVYYLGNNLDVIEVISVPTGTSVEKTFSKPGTRTKRIIIEVDAPPGGRATFRFSAFPQTSLNVDGSSRLVFNVV